ncbi:MULTISPECIES: hypothetical protein [Streptomyces]|uniref:Uncharacterized protein n=2 Tax=Streptomyces rimosus subsp. rimosus TaxID=132474 RepID=L8EPX5_STRR1|nr:MULTISPECIES: hypothetical protein [Streptomyces]KOG69753.1 hypothetical protein ADK78_32095 [Kitasatospora aureofaciens]MYT44624.1 hypothetical protein [Streptomyces sp. SID5471]KEF02402.1 hypothetical protein DF17_33895 [Streptomyces rimosus]KEF18421.1 hypothetical protein DF18_22985 [Streptomyces rimosus]KOT26820.1 hypothetical protein ADK42_37845 [Streptomyces rimosus subsp. rimosus]
MSENEEESPSPELRLLPWGEKNEKRSLLSTDGDGYVSRFADDMEAAQLDMGTTLLDRAGALLGDADASAGELRYLANRLVEALHDALRVADSRGRRVPGLGVGGGKEGVGRLVAAE